MKTLAIFKWSVLSLAVLTALLSITRAQTHSGHDGTVGAASTNACAPIAVTNLVPFVDLLPIPNVALPARINTNYCISVATNICFPGGLPEYDMPMTLLTQKFHRDLPAMEVWGYAGSSPGPTIVTYTNSPILVNWSNSLPAVYPFWLPPDLSAHGASTQVHTVVHLHGGATLPRYDGYPTNSYPTGTSDKYFYGNIDFNNDGETLWYHDHAIGLTANNVYAGLAGFYLLRNPSIEAALNIPTNAPYEVPLVIQDRDFQLNCTKPSLLFNGPFPWHRFATVNGMVTPYLPVEPRRYRFRILNGANFRGFSLNLAVSDAAGNILKETPPVFNVIGNEDGFLNTNVPIKALNMMSGERYDVIIDFTAYTNKIIVMTNNYGGNLNPPKPPEVPFAMLLTNIMQFRVGSNVTSLANNNLPATNAYIGNWASTSNMVSQAVTNRQVMIDLQTESPFPGYPFVNPTNTASPTNGPFALLNLMFFDDDITDKPRAGTTEVWSLINLSNEPHPIHVHLLDFRVVDRTRFGGWNTNEDLTLPPTMVTNYINDRIKGTLKPLANYLSTNSNDFKAARADESGPKDVVHAAPFAVTRIVMFWPTNSLFYSTPSAVNLDPNTVGRYVYHCHILDHEDNDMMRPMQLLPPAFQLLHPVADASVNPNGVNHHRLRLSARYGETYRIESTATLSPPNWVPFPGPDLIGNDDLIQIVPPSTLDPFRFYRVRRITP